MSPQLIGTTVVLAATEQDARRAVDALRAADPAHPRRSIATLTSEQQAHRLHGVIVDRVVYVAGYERSDKLGPFVWTWIASRMARGAAVEEWLDLARVPEPTRTISAGVEIRDRKPAPRRRWWNRKGAR